jgi:hypothetical protein
MSTSVALLIALAEPGVEHSVREYATPPVEVTAHRGDAAGFAGPACGYPSVAATRVTGTPASSLVPDLASPHRMRAGPIRQRMDRSSAIERAWECRQMFCRRSHPDRAVGARVPALPCSPHLRIGDASAMLLRFEGGPVDGLEESSNSAPTTLFRSPRMSEMLRATETAEQTEVPLFGALYELVHFNEIIGVALYWPVDA